jgi:DNA-directed RNA polymerase alpha subunit
VPDVPLDEMQFSTRTRNTLAANGLSSSNVIASLFITGELHKLRGVGKKSIAEVDGWIQSNKFKKRSISS